MGIGQIRYTASKQKRFCCCRETCIQLSSEDGNVTDSRPVHELYFSHEEADTNIILYCIHAAQTATSEALVVRSPDTDMFLLLLAFAATISSPLFFFIQELATDGGS